MEPDTETHLAVSLSRLESVNAGSLYQLVDRNRDFLRQWLPWVDTTRCVSDTAAFLQEVAEPSRLNQGPQFAVYWGETLCGVCGFHPFDTRQNLGSLGYWLAERYCGRGIMTEAVRQLIGIGFRKYGLSRIDIACATDNHKSRAIPERLGFYYEGVVPERETLNGVTVDHALYSLLSVEFMGGALPR